MPTGDSTAREQSLSHVAPIEDGHLVSDESVADGIDDLLTVTFGEPHGGGAGHRWPRRHLELANEDPRRSRSVTTPITVLSQKRF